MAWSWFKADLDHAKGTLRWHLSGSNFKGMYNGQNMEHITQAFKASRRHPRQTYRHAKGTEMTWWVVSNHQINAKMSCYTFTHLRPTSRNAKGLY